MGITICRSRAHCLHYDKADASIHYARMHGAAIVRLRAVGVC